MSTKMRNIGPTSARRLNVVGVRTLEDLEERGAVATFLRMHDAGFKPSLNLLYALQGALLDVHWTDLPDEMRAKLRAEVDAARKAAEEESQP